MLLAVRLVAVDWCVSIHLLFGFHFLTKEIEANGKIPLLDCLVSCDENKLRTTIYEKPTHTTGSPGSMLAVRIDSNLRQCMRTYDICSKCDIFE